VIVDENIAIK